MLLIFSALGYGWCPAIVNSQAELDFICLGQRWFSDDRSYWLGGSAYMEPWSHIDITQYRTDDKGILHQLIEMF